MTTPRDPRPSGTEDDDLLRAVLEEESLPDDRPSRRDPVSPTARQRLRADAGASPAAPRPTVEEVYGPVPTSSSARRPAGQAGKPSVPSAGASAADPEPSSQVFIGADAEPPSAAPSLRRRRRVPAAEASGAPVPHQAEPIAAPEPPAVESAVAAAPSEGPAPIPSEDRADAAPPAAGPVVVPSEDRLDAAPIQAGERHDALSGGLRRTGPDSEQIRRVEEQSPWGRLRSPQTGSTPLLAPPAVPPAPADPADAADRTRSQDGPSAGGPFAEGTGGPASSGAPREDERRGLPRVALLALLALVVVLLVVLAILFL